MNEVGEILQSLLCILQPENLTQQLTQLQILNELSHLYLETTDFPRSIDFAQKVLNIAEKLKVQSVQNFKADANYLLGVNYANQNVFEKALLHLDAYEQICRETGDELDKAKMSFTRSVIARQRHEDETSLEYAKDFLREAKKANDEVLESKALLTVANAHIRLFNVQKCLHFCDECMQLAKKNCHVKIEVETKYQKATAYAVLGENEKAYDMFMDCLAFFRADPNHKYLESKVLNNLSFAALRLNQKYDDNEFEAVNSKLRIEALVFVERSLAISKSINIPYGIALAHLNKGLLFMESYKNYDKAAENFHEELRIGKELKNSRLIHNGYCSLGRLYEAKGEIQIAEEFYTKALETEDPPCTHWGEAGNLRFSPDYLLALMYIGEKNWKDAAKCLQGVIKRCKRQGKSVKDSLLKISFNDKLTKPYQYLQYAYLEMGATEDALVIGEEGRARDFYDELIDKNDNVVESSPNPEDLLKISMVQNTAVLFISQLTVVGRVYCWFIGSNGRIMDVFWVSQDAWKPLNNKLCATVYDMEIHWRNSEISIEYRGVETLNDDAVVSKFRAKISVKDALEKDIFDPFPSTKCSSSLFKTATRSKNGLKNPIEEILKITDEIRYIIFK